jgi:histone deacetylase 1/2
MTQPQGFVSKLHPSDFVCRLKKSLYGLKQAPRAWNERFTSFLPSLGFQASPVDPSLFVQNSSLGVMILLLYVDDIILTGSHAYLLSLVIAALTQEFDMKDLGRLHYFLGLQISYLPSGLFVSQTGYITDLLGRVDLQHSKSCDTPCLPHHHLLKDDGQPYSHPQQYRSIVGTLQYLTFTRPDIAFSVNQACQFMHNPMHSHVVAVKRILRYLKGTLDVGLHFQAGPLNLQAYSDVDWAGDPNDRRSVFGSIVFLGSSPISWASKKQHTVSRFSTEAEYRALAIAAAELAWIRQLLCDIHIPLHIPLIIHCDNISAISLASNPVFHSRMKHLQIDYHFVRERVIKGDLLVQHVSSADQFADILTKGLSTPLFRHHCSNLMLGSSKHMIAGECQDIKCSASTTYQRE